MKLHKRFLDFIFETLADKDNYISELVCDWILKVRDPVFYAELKDQNLYNTFRNDENVCSTYIDDIQVSLHRKGILLVGTWQLPIFMWREAIEWHSTGKENIAMGARPLKKYCDVAAQVLAKNPNLPDCPGIL
ncbi:hypothetical protein [Altericista sp. CCNU0014]|uniref:hypothetical protein n=1 Tax=Altericista sp. CCNU0014 TaxID=3082949 RepID=UPI00384C000E